MKNQKNNNVLLLCGHGSRSKLHSINLKKIKKRIEEKINIKVLISFLEVNKPSLEDCLLKYSKKYDKIFIFPFLIFEGNHFKNDFKRLIQKYNESGNVVLIEKLSLLNEILPETVKILKKKLKTEKNTILVTSSSYSQDKFVLLNLQKYTKILSKELNVHKSFFHYVGNETKLIEKLKLIKNEKLSILLHPIFLFQGFLYSKNKKYFHDSFFKKVTVSPSLMNENRIFNLVIKKLLTKIPSTN